jgi:hypothetical protein
MVIAAKSQLSELTQCPHCSSAFLSWDKSDNEPFCFICGWRRAKRITSSQARSHFRREQDFWANLFASEQDPDDPELSDSMTNPG